MATPQSPQLGYNHNIPHRGRLYHVQTEDSGVAKAHIFTHCFYDGAIISSKKTDYQDRLDEDNLDPLIIGLMQDSHKAMIRCLRSGEFDEKIVAVVGEHPAADNKAATEAAQAQAPEPTKRPERRPVPQPKDVQPQGPPLKPGRPGPTVDPALSHPVLVSPEAHAQVAAAAAGHGQQRPSRGPSRVRRRAVGGIGGAGVRAGTPSPISERRDIIVGKFASKHQAGLDEEILSLLTEEA